MNATAEKSVGQRPRCRHDSMRSDGWLNDHCLRCGEGGYWRYGVEQVRIKVHPSGKPLVCVLEQAGTPETGSAAMQPDRQPAASCLRNAHGHIATAYAQLDGPLDSPGRRDRALHETLDAVDWIRRALEHMAGVRETRT